MDVDAFVPIFQKRVRLIIIVMDAQKEKKERKERLMVQTGACKNGANYMQHLL